ncbi:hypothetical protein DL96DRAFT_997190 [Flagelloscypha sp. PMI_526]|nr:hypothetical protein DL96DRAFT_997190 [Flagelloscypha sp. PMI_526]
MASYGPSDECIRSNEECMGAIGYMSKGNLMHRAQVRFAITQEWPGQIRCHSRSQFKQVAPADIHSMGHGRQKRMTDVSNWTTKTEGNRRNFQAAVDNPLSQMYGRATSFTGSKSTRINNDKYEQSRSPTPVVLPPGFPGSIMHWRDTPRSKINLPSTTVPNPHSEHHRCSHSHPRHQDMWRPDPSPSSLPHQNQSILRNQLQYRLLSLQTIRKVQLGSLIPMGDLDFISQNKLSSV